MFVKVKLGAHITLDVIAVEAAVFDASEMPSLSP